jgi:siroheme synthase-like protein
MTEPSARPPFYPVSLDVSGRSCLVVGGGKVAARKARTLLDCGADVTVIAPSLSAEMDAIVPSLVALERRPYGRGDASAFRLVVTATGDPEVDGAVYADADAAGIWVNSADDRAHSSFILPAVHRDGAVTVAVSTGGRSPALASWLRTRLAAQCGDGLGTLAQLLGDAREHLTRAGVRSDAVDWAQLLDGPLPELVRSGDIDNARAIVETATTTPRQQ